MIDKSLLHPDRIGHEGNAERITDKRRIGYMLRDLMEHHAMLTVSVPEHDDPCNSVIYRLDPEQRILYLDELTPRSGHERFIAAGRGGVHAMLHGIHTYFRSEVASHGEENGIAYYRIPYPDVLFYEQKRQHYRAYIGMTRHVPVEIGTAHESCFLSGRLYDLSVGGVGIRFSPGTLITEGELLTNCRIELPGEGHLDCSLEVRQTRHDPTHDEIHVGARFVQLQGQQERAVQRCVAALERESARKQPKE